MSARAGFLKYQLDLAWIYIYCLYRAGMVSSYRDSKKKFMERHAALAVQRAALGPRRLVALHPDKDRFHAGKRS